MGGSSGVIDYVRVLGAVQVVTTSGQILDLPSPTQRRLVGLLATHAPGVVRADVLCDALGVSAGGLRTSVSRLRKVLGDGTVAATHGGYRLSVPVDAALFSSLLSSARSSNDPVRALKRAREMWAGPPFDEFSGEAWAAPDVARLTELHASVTEDLALELITRHRWAEAVAELQGHVAAHPLRDRPRGLLIRALAGAGRQADSLRAFQDYRAHLADSVGTEPSAEVRQLEQRVAAGWGGVEEETPGEVTAPHVTTGHQERAGSERLPLPLALSKGPILVGRSHELELLMSDFARVGAPGHLRTVIVEGEAGIGKTTLLRAMARAVSHQGGAVALYGYCQDGLPVPLQPFRSVLEHLVEHASVDLLQAHISRYGSHLARIVPRLADRAEILRVATTDDATERHLVFEAVGDLLKQVAATMPLVILLDDLQWAEPTALHLLRHLGRALADAPVLLVLSARDINEAGLEGLAAVVADLERGPSRRLHLRGFDNDELADLTASLVARDGAPVAKTVVARLGHETAGNPLYATQLVRHWAESGRLILDTAEIELVDSAQAHEVPANLRNLLWSRVNALGGAVTEVLSAAAVLGTEFTEATVVDMVGISQHDAMDALDSAQLAGLLADIGTSTGTMRFVHVLVANVVYSKLPGRRRRRLHAEAARALEKRADASLPRVAAQLARHCALAGSVPEAQRWATVAGDYAVQQLSPAEAVYWYRVALEHATALGASEQDRADLLARLGSAQGQANDPEALTTLTEAVALARRVGADSVVVRAALATDRGFLRLGVVDPAHIAIVESALEVVGDDGSARARLLALLAEPLAADAGRSRRVDLAKEAVALADASGNPLLLAEVCSSVLFALWGPDQEATRLRADVARRSIAAVDGAGSPHLEFSVHAAAYTVAIQLADPAGAISSLKRLHSIADEVGAPLMTWTIGFFDAFVATMEARFADAERLAQQTVELGLALGGADAVKLFAGQAAVLATIAGHQTQLPPMVVQAIEAGPVQLTLRLAHAIVSVASGPKEVANTVLHEGLISGFADVGPDLMWMTSMLGYAILAIELQNLDAAAQLLAILEPFAGQVATSLGPVVAYMGRLASLLGCHDEAERHLMAALHIADTFDWDYYRATTLIALGDCRQRRLGWLDGSANAYLDEAERICTTKHLPNLLAVIAGSRAEAPPVAC